MKKIVSLIVALMMVMSVAAFAETEVPPTFYDNYPIVEPGSLTLEFTSMITPVQKDYNDNIWIWNTLEEKTGIHINWTNIPSADLSQQISLLLGAYDLPDVFFKCGISITDQAKYGADGTFVDLVAYKDVMPNLWYWYDEFPTAKNAMTQESGAMYATPYLLTGYAIRMGSRIWFSSKVMEGIGWDHVPTTTDELYDFLLAAKDFDYNENGQADEIPLVLSGNTNGGDNLDGVLFGSFGLRNHGSSFSYVDEDYVNGGLRFIRTCDDYKDYLAYTAKLYQADLIDHDLFTTGQAEEIAKCATGQALTYIFVNNSPAAGSPYEQYTVPMTQPFEGTYNLWTAYSMPASTGGQFVITEINEHPEESAKWVDYLYSEDGIKGYFLGVQGENADDPNGTWYYDEETGLYDYTNWILHDPNNISFEELLNPYVVWQGGSNPSVATNSLFKGGETWPLAVVSATGLKEYIPEEVWAPVTFSADIAKELSAMQADFQTYYREFRAQVWQGTKSLDADWDAYVEGFNAFGVEQYMKYYTDACIAAGYLEG